ncbi:MAG: DNA-3-methyladenine glycosylase I [bacterium]|nr:DNA-3-methyladenine glycosylase I [bacterium]
MMKRCAWAQGQSSLYESYHDTEWGVPVHDDRLLFEFLILEGAQAGLSWETILKKRDHYRRVYDRFDPHKVARYDDAKQAALLADPGIVRNRLKVAASVTNAQAFLEVQAEFGSFDAYIWDFVDGEPIQNRFGRMVDIPANTPVSEAMSKDLKRRGFRFVGGTIAYAFMQAAGLVNDHETGCYRHAEVAGLADNDS